MGKREGEKCLIFSTSHSTIGTYIEHQKVKELGVRRLSNVMLLFLLFYIILKLVV